MTGTAGSWLRLHAPRERPGALLVCFPPTGAHASAFASWLDARPPDVALALVTAPGRGSRLAEDAVTGLSAYVAAVAREIGGLRPREPLVLVGVSLGALLAYETACRLLDAGVPVARLCAVASPAPRAVRGSGTATTAADARAFVLDTGLTAPELLDDPEFEELLLPPVLADLRLTSDYDGSDRPALPVPLRALYATEDEYAGARETRGWAEFTTADFDVLPVPGSHYAHDENPGAVIGACLKGLPGSGS